MRKGMAIGGLVLVTIIWGGGFTASDIALESMTPFQIMTVRFFLAAILMGLISIRSLKGMKKEEIRARILMRIALFASFALQIVGLQYTTPSKNAFLNQASEIVKHFPSK